MHSMNFCGVCPEIHPEVLAHFRQWGADVFGFRDYMGVSENSGYLILGSFRVL